jgi:signal transduction histidine kinase
MGYAFIRSNLMENKEKYYFTGIIWKTIILICILWVFVFQSVKISNFSKTISNARYEVINYGYSVESFTKKIKPNKMINVDSKEVVYFDERGNKTFTLRKEFSSSYKMNEIFIYPLSAEIGMKIQDEIFIIKMFDGFLNTFFIFSGFLPFFIVWVLIIFKGYEKMKKEETIFKISRAENTAGHQSLTVLTENLHHELNTPLTIIEGKINRLESNIIKILNFSLKKNYKSFNDLTDKEVDSIDKVFKVKRIKKDKEYLEMSLDQIKGILINMKDFKMLRHSNGNKTIYDILDGSANTLKISIGGLFDIDVDERLKNYGILHNSNMKNSDLINAVINHVKNSYEANSEKIKFVFYSFKNNKLCVLLKDDGNGIADKDKDKVFEPNYSTKADKLGRVRGNGMFVNKKILENFGCSDELFSTREGFGTTFKICIPAEEKKV